MKADKILESLMDVAKAADYTVRRETGTFRGGACVIRDQRLILINRSMPAEAAAVILARALAKIGIEDDSFLKPAVRDLLDRERAWVASHPEVTFALEQA
ncbi:MAG: hypothetical protein ACO3I4_04455 [Candidatus Kapaibacteriota bacterium]|jgi:hypothetical protein